MELKKIENLEKPAMAAKRRKHWIGLYKSVGTVLIDLIDLKEVKKNRPW